MRFILWLTIAVATGTYITGPLQDPDLWWHLTVGKWILAHNEVPHVDYWSLWGSGKEWRAYSWLVEILFAGAHSLYGVYGLLVLKFFSAILLCISLSYALSRIASDWLLGLLLGCYVTVSCFNHFTLRPQSFVWIYFGLLLYVAEQVARNGLSRQRGFCIFLLFVLWANSHLSALIGVFSLACWLWPTSGRFKDIDKRMWGALAIGIMGTFITPYLGGEWATLFRTSSHPFEFNAIAEFQPANILQYSTGFLLLLVVFVLSFGQARVLSLGVAKLFCAGCLTLGAISVIKFLPFAMIYLCFLVASLWRVHKEDLGFHLVSTVNFLRRLVSVIPYQGLSFVFLCLSVVNVYKVWHYPLELRTIPISAVDFIEDYKLPQPLLNMFGQGGYLIYRWSNSEGMPSHKVTIDGRTNLLSREVWKKYLSVLKGEPNWKEYFELIKPNTVLWEIDSPLVSILLESKEWCRVFENKVGGRGVAVFVKRDYFEGHREEIRSDNCNR